MKIGEFITLRDYLRADGRRHRAIGVLTCG
jgi:hypothetical protein